MNSRVDSRKVRVGLVQINNSFSGQSYLPYATGLLQVYAQKHLARPERYEFLLPLYTRVPPQQAVETLEGADVVLFSTYVWNIRISSEIARRLKERRSDTIIVFGGPQVPDRVEEFLRKNRFIDLACHGEGEQATLAVLENCETRNWGAVPSVSFLRDDLLVQNPRPPRIKELGSVPSPYLEGTFDPLMAAKPDEHWIALWETNRGCPFQCTFCDWGSAVAGKVYTWDLERLFREVEWFAQHQTEFVFCCDANFGMLPRDLDLARHVAKTKRERGYPHALSVQNTKNVTERAYQVQKILADAGLNKGVDIALQSVDATTLENVKRANISLDTYFELQRRFTQDSVDTYTDMILGMPGETYDSFVDGVSTIIERGQHNRIQFNNLSILPNAEMADPEYMAKFGMIMVESDIINIHGSLVEFEGDVQEKQQLIIGTDSMPPADWVRTRAFCWMVALLHFDKVLQIPLVLVRELAGVRYRELFAAFTSGEALSEFPVLSEVWSFFLDKARNIRDGGPEYCHSAQWLGIWWPADEHILIRLCYEDRLEAFYGEAQRVLERFLRERAAEVPPGVLAEAIVLNKALLKRPFQTQDLDIGASYNIWEFYKGVLRGQPVPLERRPQTYHIDRTRTTWSSWDDWCREVIWWGNKRGAYLYSNQPFPQPELAGHY